MATVVLVGTLDTKGVEYGFLRDRLREAGVDVVLVDAGVLGEPRIEPDMGREEVARAGGADHAELVRAGDRGAAVDAMGRGRRRCSRACTPRAAWTARPPSAARATRRSPRRRCATCPWASRS